MAFPLVPDEITLESLAEFSFSNLYGISQMTVFRPVYPVATAISPKRCNFKRPNTFIFQVE